MDLFHHDNDEEQLLIAFGPAGFSQHHYAHLSASLSYLNMLVSYCPAGAVKQRPPSGKIAPLRSARAPYACAPHSARRRARARRQSCPKSRRWSTRAPPRWPRRPRRRRPRHRRSRRVRNRPQVHENCRARRILPDRPRSCCRYAATDIPAWQHSASLRPPLALLEEGAPTRRPRNVGEAHGRRNPPRKTLSATLRFDRGEAIEADHQNAARRPRPDAEPM